MNLRLSRLPGVLVPLLMLSGCGWFDNSQHGTSRVLNNHLRTQLAPDIQAGTVALQPMPDGARVTILHAAQAPVGGKPLDEAVGDIRASVIEGLLDPTLLRIKVSDTSNAPPEVRDARVRHVVDYFRAYLLGSTLVAEQSVSPPAATAAPAGVAIAIAVVCPSHGSSGYDNAVSPACN